MPKEHEMQVDGRTLITVEELAKRFKYSEHHVRTYVRLNKLPGARKIGRRWWFDVETFKEQYIEGQRSETPGFTPKATEVTESRAKEYDILGDL